MIFRVVRMTFRPEACEEFQAIFDRSKSQIRSFEGCKHLELWRDAQVSNVFLTFSHWHNEAALEAYRQSALFRTTWAATKVLFAAPPLAFSVTQQEVVTPLTDPV
jgi:quinol monooxygenase YgiN